MDEHQAIAQLKRGNIAGLETLVHIHQLHARRAAYLVTRDLALAEDIVQTAFVRVYERIDQFDASRPFGPWFLRMVVNDAVKAAQRHERWVSLNTNVTADQVLADVLADKQPGPDDVTEHAETQRSVWTALSKLSPEQRAVIVRRYYLGMSEADMAGDLDLPQSTIKWRLHAARKRLQVLLHALRPTPPDDGTPKHDAQMARIKQETLR